MAITKVQGKITRVFHDGKGAEVTENFMMRGQEISKRWTAWFEQPHGLDVGTDVEVSGLHSDVVDEWEKSGEIRHSVKRSLNKARIATPQPTTAPPAAQDEPWNHPTDTGSSPWRSTPVSGDESSTPF